MSILIATSNIAHPLKLYCVPTLSKAGEAPFAKMSDGPFGNNLPVTGLQITEEILAQFDWGDKDEVSETFTKHQFKRYSLITSEKINVDVMLMCQVQPLFCSFWPLNLKFAHPQFFYPLSQ